MSSVGRSSFLSSRRRPSAPRTAVALATALAVIGSGLVAVQVATPPVRAAVAATATSPAEKPDLVSARLAARLGGHRVEITGERTETASTFANPDGTLTTETAARPVRVRRGTDWVPVDPTLVAANGAVSPRATTVGLALSGGGAGDLVRLSAGRPTLALRWPHPLPTPVLSGASATYPDVLPGVDLKVTADVAGFEQLLVVKAVPQSPLGTIRIPLSLSGLTASQDAGGNLVFKDSSGAVVAASPAPRMWGATRDAGGTEPIRSAPVRTALVTVGGAQELDLTPDPAFLADPAVTYPVTIDPAVTVALAHWTYVDKAYPTTNYYNSADIARVGSWNGGAQVDRSIFSFDVSRFRGTHVLSATLNTYENSAYSCTAAPVDLWDAGPTSTATT